MRAPTRSVRASWERKTLGTDRSSDAGAAQLLCDLANTGEVRISSFDVEMREYRTSVAVECLVTSRGVVARQVADTSPLLPGLVRVLAVGLFTDAILESADSATTAVAERAFLPKFSQHVGSLAPRAVMRILPRSQRAEGVDNGASC
jgi:hypothetical protein